MELHPHFRVSFLELHPLMELITGTQHCENIRLLGTLTFGAD
jgi:hypothetical protein